MAAFETVRSFANFLSLGVKHILTGYDHLLFLFGLLIVARGFLSALTIITSFTIAHSITLAVATLHLVQIPSRIVEPLIAASIVFVGVENLLRGDIPNARRMVPFGFGLIHGFGFASALREAGIGSGAGGIVSTANLFQPRRGARSNHGRCRGAADHLETPGEPHVCRAVGAGVFSCRCAPRQFLARGASVHELMATVSIRPGYS